MQFYSANGYLVENFIQKPECDGIWTATTFSIENTLSTLTTLENACNLASENYNNKQLYKHEIEAVLTNCSNVSNQLFKNVKIAFECKNPCEEKWTDVKKSISDARNSINKLKEIYEKISKIPPLTNESDNQLTLLLANDHVSKANKVKTQIENVLMCKR